MIVSIITFFVGFLCGERTPTKNTTKSSVKDVTTANRVVDQTEATVRIVPLPWDTLEMLTVGDSSFMNMENAATQVAWARKHHVVDTCPGSVSMVANVKLTGCNSVFDHLHKQGPSPADDRQAALVVQILRDLQHANGMRVRWVATAQMIADALTKKESLPAWLTDVLQTSELHITERPDFARVHAEERWKAKDTKNQAHEQPQQAKGRSKDEHHAIASRRIVLQMRTM